MPDDADREPTHRARAEHADAALSRARRVTRFRYVLRSLVFHRRTHAGVVLGTALGAAVLAGALMVGDSVRHTLERLTHARLGSAAFAATSPERLFGSDLAARLDPRGETPTAAVLILGGVALAPEGDRRVNDAQVVGVDEAFWNLAPSPGAPGDLAPGAVFVNRAFADRLDLAEGDAFVLRLRKPGALPSDLALASRDGDEWARRLHVARVLDAGAFGHFTLRATQAPPPTVFLPRPWLAGQLGVDGRANTILVGDPDGALDAGRVRTRLASAWTPADSGLRLHALPDGTVELQSDRVFLDPSVETAARAVTREVRPVLTYLVNRIEADDRATPYSFASAPGPPRVPDSLADDEVLVNDWLAGDLGIEPGAVVTLHYYAVDAGRRLEERSAAFTVAGIVPIEPEDRELTPHIPGLSDADHCRDWDPGIPIDLDRIRTRDEVYWDDYGPTPKLYLTGAAAERLWANRFGRATALRFPPSAGNTGAIREELGRHLRAGDLGVAVHAVREEGLAASREAVDFGQLFIGLSFFLIAAAVLLTALLFAFGLEQRAPESGTLRALGFPPRSIARLRTAEALALIGLGAGLGAVFAAGYNALVLRALETVWRGAVGAVAFEARIRPASVLAGIAATAAAAAAATAGVLRGQMRRTIRGLQQREPTASAKGHAGRLLAAGLAAVLLAAAGIAAAGAGRDRAAAGVFFGAGGLLLAGLLTLAAGALRLAGAHAASGPPRPLVLALRGMGRRPGRSLACVALLALGVFLTVAVGANRRGPVRDPADPASGTGGYLLWAQTTLPLLDDLNTERGRARFGLPAEELDGVRFDQLRLREGDDASCLNLHRVAAPHLLGIDPAVFDARGAFTFARRIEGADPAHPWRLLDLDLGPDTVPAVADQADITWGLGLALGDTLAFTDESGRPFRVKLVGGLANSILQGHLVVAERHLEERFPSLAGTRVLLVEAPPERETELLGRLTARLSDLGLAAVPTRGRLAEFDRVENTYLAIFFLLGALGVLVGSAGMGIVAARNILERRAELALLRAVGFARRQVGRQVFAEHALLAATGILVGGAAALVAAAPALRAPESGAGAGPIAAVLAAVLAGSLLWTALAVRLALRGDPAPALRDE